MTGSAGAKGLREGKRQAFGPDRNRRGRSILDHPKDMGMVGGERCCRVLPVAVGVGQESAALCEVVRVSLEVVLNGLGFIGGEIATLGPQGFVVGGGEGLAEIGDRGREPGESAVKREGNGGEGDDGCEQEKDADRTGTHAIFAACLW